MSSEPTRQLMWIPRVWRTLAFRLTAIYALAGMFLVFVATASLYLLLDTELEKSTNLFLQDKVHVISTMLRERPDDEDALREEVELESAARRYEQFYIRLLDQQEKPLLTTPGMAQVVGPSRVSKEDRRQAQCLPSDEREGRTDLPRHHCDCACGQFAQS